MFIHTYLPKKHDKQFREIMKLLGKKEYELAQEGIIFYLETINSNLNKKHRTLEFLQNDLKELGKDVARV